MIGILSDAHGNHGGFHTAIFHLRSLGAKSFYFLGDAVGYVPSLEVIEALQSMGSEVKCILGNHEEMLLRGATTLKRERIYQHQRLRRRLSTHHIDFLKSWPSHRREIIAETSALFVHGSPNDYTNGYVYPDTDLHQFNLDVSFVFMGHSHYPFIRSANGTTFVNVGSCGLPRDDGRFGGACLFDPGTGNAQVLRFDITEKTKAVLEENPSVHPVVHDVLARRNDSIFGEFV
jgi:predicted phosphodiesterase